jgi:hypothetical protein
VNVGVREDVVGRGGEIEVGHEAVILPGEGKRSDTIPDSRDS